MKVMMPFPPGRSRRVDAVIGCCFTRAEWVCVAVLSHPREPGPPATAACPEATGQDPPRAGAQGRGAV